MPQIDAELSARLEGIRAEGLYRKLRRVNSPQGPRIEINGRTLLNFSSNDYLGFANHPALKEAAIRAVEKFGAGAGASRLICGSLSPYHELEESIAAFKRTEAALSFATGYAAALGTITALVGKDDVIVIDKLVHASIVDAAKLSGAKLRVFAHNDLNDLENILQWATKNQSEPRTVLIVTESVFSMDGDTAPLREIVQLKEKYGAWLMVDEAHATGLYGERRSGLAEELGVSAQVDVQMGTLGKAIGASGGYICGSRKLMEYLINRARSFIFSTAPVPAAAAAAKAGIELVQTEEGAKALRELWNRRAELGEVLRIGERQDACPMKSAIVPILLGEEAKAVAAATELRERGIFVPAIRYPTVARGAARLRVTLTAAHTAEDIDTFGKVLTTILGTNRD